MEEREDQPHIVALSLQKSQLSPAIAEFHEGWFDSTIGGQQIPPESRSSISPEPDPLDPFCLDKTASKLKLSPQVGTYKSKSRKLLPWCTDSLPSFW